MLRISDATRGILKMTTLNSTVIVGDVLVINKISKVKISKQI